MTTLLHVYHSRYDHTATCLPFTLDIHACKTMGLAEFPGRQHVLHGLYPLGMDPLAAPKGWPFAPLYKAHSWSPTLNALIQSPATAVSTKNPRQTGITKCLLPQTEAHHLLSKHCHVDDHPHPKSTETNHTWMGSWPVTVWSRLVTVGHGPRPFNYILGVYFWSRSVTPGHGPAWSHIRRENLTACQTFFRHDI